MDLWDPPGFTGDGSEENFQDHMVFQDGPTGSTRGDWAHSTDSPKRALDSEPGVQAPVGLWDPPGFTTDGGEKNPRATCSSRTARPAAPGRSRASRVASRS